METSITVDEDCFRGQFSAPTILDRLMSVSQYEAAMILANINLRTLY